MLKIHLIERTLDHQTMHDTLIKKVVLLSLFGFILAVLAISLHHHDNSFSLPTCSICKVKTSISGTFNKIKTNYDPTAASLTILLTMIFLSLSDISPDRNTIFIDFQVAVTYPNKAPPFRS
jgi:hypothetical protein